MTLYTTFKTALEEREDEHNRPSTPLAIQHHIEDVTAIYEKFQIALASSPTSGTFAVVPRKFVLGPPTSPKGLTLSLEYIPPGQTELTQAFDLYLLSSGIYSSNFGALFPMLEQDIEQGLARWIAKGDFPDVAKQAILEGLKEQEHATNAPSPETA